MSVLFNGMLLGAGETPFRVNERFSVDTWAGDGASETVVNGVGLAGYGGLAWVKNISGTAESHSLFDTARGVNKPMATNALDADATVASSLTAFNSDGFSLGSAARVNGASRNFVGYAFRKSARFFDAVLYTGNGAASQTLAHALAGAVGMIIVKSLASDYWYVYHRGVAADPETDYLVLNLTNAVADNVIVWNDTAPTSGQFTVGSLLNASGQQYIAYLFAHDAASDGIIQCGSVTGTGSAGQNINLGWRPQWALFKRSDSASDWLIYDTARGWASGDGSIATNYLAANLNSIQGSVAGVNLAATGMNVGFGSANRWAYVAIREES